MGNHNARRTRRRAESAAAARGASSREGHQASGTLEVSPPPTWHSAPPRCRLRISVAFSSFSACARPSISERVDIWRIEGLLTHKLYRNGCIKGDFKIFPDLGYRFRVWAFRLRDLIARRATKQNWIWDRGLGGWNLVSEMPIWDTRSKIGEDFEIALIIKAVERTARALLFAKKRPVVKSEILCVNMARSLS